MELGPIQKTVAILCELDREIQTSNDISTWRSVYSVRRTSRKHEQIWAPLVNFVHVCGKFQTVSKPNMLLLFSKKAKWTKASWNCRFIGQILDTETRQKNRTTNLYRRKIRESISHKRPSKAESIAYDHTTLKRPDLVRSRPISSDLGSYATSGPVSTCMGDRLGIPGAVGFLFDDSSNFWQVGAKIKDFRRVVVTYSK